MLTISLRQRTVTSTSEEVDVAGVDMQELGQLSKPRVFEVADAMMSVPRYLAVGRHRDHCVEHRYVSCNICLYLILLELGIEKADVELRIVTYQQTALSKSL